MNGLNREEGINQVFNGGRHVVILGAGASIASNHRTPELNGKELPSMNNLIDIVGLRDIVEKVPESLRSDNFETLYANLFNNLPNSEIINEIESRVMDYFQNMALPDVPTIYDYLILSLRNKDLIATFNWDPFLFQAYSRNKEFTDNLPALSFLHGNVAIGYCREFDKAGPAGMYMSEKGGYFEPTRLLYPIDHKDYNSDEFIRVEWEKLQYWLSKDSGSVRTTIFGYSAPVSDIEAVSLLRNAWGTPEERDMEQFEIIDVVPEAELRERWDDFIHTHHYDVIDNYFESSLAKNPRRTSESFFCHFQPMSISEAFRESNPIPQDFDTLEALWNWHADLIEAENRNEMKNKNES